MTDTIIGSIAWELDLDDKKFQAGLSGASKQAKDFGSTMAAGTRQIGQNLSSLGRTLSIGVTAPIVGFGLLAAKEFGEFNAAIERAGAFVDATKEQMEEFSKASIKAVEGTKFSALDAADALGSFVGGEISAEEATESLGDIIDLALVSKMDNLKDATNLAGLALTTFKKDGMEVKDVIDVMAQFTAKVDDRTDSFARALNNSAASARAAGLDFQNLTVLLSIIRRGGMDLDVAWAGVNRALVMIQDPSDGAVAALKSVGFAADTLKQALAEGGVVGFIEKLREGFDKANESGKGLAFLNSVLGEGSKAFATALTLQNDELEETAGWFANVEGKGATMVGRIRDAIPALDRLQTAFRNIGIAMGEPINKIIDTFASVLEKVLAVVNKLTPKQKEWIVYIGIAAAIVGPLILVLGTLAAAIGFLATPIGLIATAIAVFAGLFAGWIVFIIAKWDEMVAAFKSIPSRISNALKGVYDAIVGAFKSAFEWVIRKSEEVWEKLQKLNPFHRESPSLVDNVTNGMTIIKDQFASLNKVDIPSANQLIPGAQNIASSNTFTFNVSDKVDLASVLEQVDLHLGTKGLQANYGIS